jgi:hypothetical protein
VVRDEKPDRPYLKAIQRAFRFAHEHGRGCGPAEFLARVLRLRPKPNLQQHLPLASSTFTSPELNCRFDGEPTARPDGGTVGTYPSPGSGPHGDRCARSPGQTCSLVSLIAFSHNIAEIMAYTEEKGSYSSPEFPRKPDVPR